MEIKRIMAISPVNAYAYVGMTTSFASEGSTSGTTSGNDNANATATSAGASVPSTGSLGGTPTSLASIDPFQSISTFIREVYAALRAQANSTDSTNAATASTSTATSSQYSSVALTSRLQSVLSQLSSSTQSSNPAMAALQQTFTQLLTAAGLSASDVNSPGFLQTLTQNSLSYGDVGNIVSVTA